MDLNTTKVLVTGANGWLGSRLVDVLCQGLPDHAAFKAPLENIRIRCLILPGENPDRLRQLSPRVEIIQGNVENAMDCTRFCSDAKGALLFHTAGIIHPAKVAQLYRVNVEGTKNLLRAAGQAGVGRAVVVSSNSPCGCNPNPQHRFDESSPYHPYMHYGRSKMLMEQAVNDLFKQGAIETVLIRPPWFYGPNQPPRQTLFFRMIREGKGPIVGSGDNMRSMSYVDNLCQGLLLAATVPRARGQTYWIADRQPYSMNQIVDTVERLIETEFGMTCAHKRLRLPGIASEVAQLVDFSLQSLGLYHQKIHVLSEMNKNIACSVARAENELGYRPSIALEEGMRRSLAWCRANNLAF